MVPGSKLKHHIDVQRMLSRNSSFLCLNNMDLKQLRLSEIIGIGRKVAVLVVDRHESAILCLEVSLPDRLVHILLIWRVSVSQKAKLLSALFLKHVRNHIATACYFCA